MHDLEGGLQGGGAGHRTCENAERVADLDTESLAKPQRNHKSSDYCDEREQIVFDACRACHSFEELPSVQDPDAVQEHDQPGQADRSGDLRLGGEGADRQPDEQDGSDAEREAA